ncbi:MAG: hypothetical protein ACK56F_32350, partial [bacterium]
HGAALQPVHRRQRLQAGRRDQGRRQLRPRRVQGRRRRRPYRRVHRLRGRRQPVPPRVFLRSHLGWPRHLRLRPERRPGRAPPVAERAELRLRGRPDRRRRLHRPRHQRPARAGVLGRPDRRGHRVRRGVPGGVRRRLVPAGPVRQHRRHQR